MGCEELLGVLMQCMLTRGRASRLISYASRFRQAPREPPRKVAIRFANLWHRGKTAQQRLIARSPRSPVTRMLNRADGQWLQWLVDGLTHQTKQILLSDPNDPVTVKDTLHSLRNFVEFRWAEPESSKYSDKTHNQSTVSGYQPASTEKRFDLSKVQCFGCGKMGHFKSQCKEPKRHEWK